MNEAQHKILQEALDIAPSIIQDTFRFSQKSLKKDFVYYYTSLDTLVNGIIVENPEPNKEICIWATRWSHMNDKSEVKTGLDLLREGNMPSHIVNYHEKFINNLHVICFSENKDKLQMWNAYGKRGSGVMLALDLHELLRLYPYLLKQCIYEDTGIDKKLIEKIANCNFGENFNDLNSDSRLIAATVCMVMFISLYKNKAYHYEREVRLTGIGLPLLSNVPTSKYRVQDGLIIPYIPVYFPKQILKQIWLGPCTDHERNKKILEELLNTKGLKAEVIISTKPYRG